MSTSSFASASDLPEMRSRLFPHEQMTAEMQEPWDVIPSQQWIRSDEATLHEQLLERVSEQDIRKEKFNQPQITMKNRRGKGKKRRQVRKGGGNSVIIKTEPIDDSVDARQDSAYGSSPKFPSHSDSRPPPRRAWTAPRADSIINIIALCTHPGQTIKPSSVNQLYTLQHRIDAAMDNEGPLRNILRNLPRDITLTVERKETIWVAQGKLNRVVKERQRSRRRQKIDRYTPAHRWIPIDRYIPGVPYDPKPHILAMRLFSRAEA